MARKVFGDFIDKKKRDSIKQLKIVKKILEANHMKVEDFLESSEDHDPYIFCHNPLENASFQGVRIYKIGRNIAFRIQKESKTHPYGSAYELPIETMYQDFLADEGVNEVKAGKKIIESVNNEIVRFFKKSLEAESKLKTSDYAQNGGVMMRANITDFGNLLSINR